MPSNREIAVVLWLAAIVAFACRDPKLRGDFVDLLRRVFMSFLIVPILLIGAYVAGLVVVGAELGWWHPGLSMATAFWTVTVALVMLFDLRDVVRERWYLFRELRRVISATFLVEFVVGLSAFGLVTELTMQGVLGLVMMVEVASRRKPEHEIVGKTMRWILAVAGIWLLIDGATELVAQVRGSESVAVLQELALPVWLTIGFVPMMWLIGTAAGYEMGVKELVVRRLDAPLLRRLRGLLALVVVFRTRRDLVDRFTAHTRSIDELIGADSVRAAIDGVGEFRDRWEYSEKVQRERGRQLERLAGVPGVDEGGFQLDRREFKETRDALRWLDTCMRGHHNKIGRYPDDLLDVLIDGVRFRDLPTGGRDIQLNVSTSGKSYYAWRETASGWCFAIASTAINEPSWQLDGPKPPTGSPGEDPCWGDGPLQTGRDHNWRDPSDELVMAGRR